MALALLLIPIALLAAALWLEHRERRAGQVANNQRFNAMTVNLRDMGAQAGWDDSKAKTIAFDPEVMRELRKETGPR